MKNRTDCSFGSLPASWGNPADVLVGPCMPGNTEGWVIEPVAWQPLTVGTGLDFRAAVDREGKVHVAYADSAIRYGQRGVDGWSFQVVPEAREDPLTAAIGAKLSLAIDSAGRAHLLFSNQATGGALSYATNASGTWVSEGIGAAPRELALTLDGSDTVHVTFVPFTGGQRLQYAVRSSQGFLPIEVSTKDVTSVQLLFVADALTWIYQAGDGSIERVLRLDQEFVTSRLGRGQHPSAAASPNGDLVVAYGTEGAQGARVELAKVADGRVQIELLWEQNDPRHALESPMPSIAIDQTGAVLVTHRTPQGIVLAQRRAEEWTSELVAAQASEPQLVLDAAGAPHVFYAVEVDDRAELRHAFQGNCGATSLTF